MPVDLGRHLIAAQLVSPEEVEAALFLSVVRGVCFVRALVDRGAISERALEQELGRRGGLVLRHVVGHPELFARLPPALCRRLGAVPTRLDSLTGTVDVAAADPLDTHVANEIGFHLGAPVRVLSAPLGAIEEAIRRLELEQPPRPETPHDTRSRRSTPVFPHGAPSSVPPPSNDDVPIPLVRRLGVPLIDDDAETIDAVTRTYAPDEPVLALKRSKVVPNSRSGGSAERPFDGAVTSVVGPPSSLVPTQRLESARERESTERPPVIREPATPPPSVSFPSEPPGPPDGSESAPITPRRGGVGTLPSQPSVAAFVPSVSIPPLRVPRPITVPAPSPVPASPPETGLSDDPTEISGPSVPSERKPPDVVLLARRVREARSRDDVVARTLDALDAISERAAVFAVKKDGFHGWKSTGLADPDAIRRVVVAHDVPSILATAAAAGFYLGPVPPTPAHAELLRVLGAPRREVAAATVKVGGRPAMMLVCDGLDEGDNHTRTMTEIAAAAGVALTRLLRGG